MYSPSLHLKTMPKSSFVIDKETTSALFISLTRDTECYATEIEQLEPDGVMTNPYDQAVVFITAVLLFGNVMPKL